MKKKIFTKDNLIFFLILNLGLIFTAVGISIFKTPNHFAFGGTSGLSIILSTLFPKWNVGAIHVDRQRSAGCTRIFLSGNPFYGLDYLFLLCPVFLCKCL